MNVNIIPIKELYNLIHNYGPSLRPEMSRMDYNTYKVYYKEKVPEEKFRMKLFMNHFSNAVPSQKALKQLSNYIGKEKALELNANLGLWSYLLYNEYVDIVATNDHTNKNLPLFMPIETINYLDAFKKYNTRKTLLLECSNAYFVNKKIDEILDNFKGDRIILICEEDNINKLITEITGGIKRVLSRFKKDSNKLDSQWINVNSIRIPQWLDHNMNIYLLEKQSTLEQNKLDDYEISSISL